MATDSSNLNRDQLGTGTVDGIYIQVKDPTTLLAHPMGSDQAVDGLVGVQAGTGNLYYASAASGDTGLRGMTGIRGTTGIQGLTGNTGIYGLTGIAGSTVDPWRIDATRGSISGWDSTGGIYIYSIAAGRTGIFPFYYNA